MQANENKDLVRDVRSWTKLPICDAAVAFVVVFSSELFHRVVDVPLSVVCINLDAQSRIRGKLDETLLHLPCCFQQSLTQAAVNRFLNEKVRHSCTDVQTRSYSF